MLLRTLGACLYDVKLLLFMSYCGSMYTSSIWCKYTKKLYYQMEVAYNKVFRRLFGYDRFSSASQMFVENRVDNFGACMRRLIYGFSERSYASNNCLVIRLINSTAWSNSELCQKWENVYMYNHVQNSIQYFFSIHVRLIWYHIILYHVCFLSNCILPIPLVYQSHL